MMRNLRFLRIWITLSVVFTMFAIPQSGSAQSHSAIENQATGQATSSSQSTKKQSLSLRLLHKLPFSFVHKKNLQKPKVQPSKPGLAIYNSEDNDPTKAMTLEVANTEVPLRSNRYSPIPIRPLKRFSDFQSISSMNNSYPTPTYSSTPPTAVSNAFRTVSSKHHFIQPAIFPYSPLGKNRIQQGNLRTASAETGPAPTLVIPGKLNTQQATLEDDRWVKLNLNETPISDRLSYSSHNGKISLIVRDAPISAVIGLIAQQNGLNIVANSDVVGNVTVTLTDVSLDDALSSILLVNGYIWTRSNNVLLVSGLTKGSVSSPLAQGKEVQVFALNYVSALEIDRVVKGLLSPVGQSFTTETSPTEKLKTREQIVVEDLPEYVARIAQYIQQVDFPPRQVYIEAHVLQITLQDDNRHGVNFEQIIRFGNSKLSLQTTGFANPVASPAFSLGLDSTDLTALIELLKTTTDSKTLASPKVMVLNGQEARIQIGEQLGYFVTTTTQTSTLQQVNFLDLGVVLRVTPQITDNNQILMTVKPEVSSGRINPNTNLPEEDTTEVETTIMLNDGQGMIIGGLIKETDIDIQSKIPILGDLWGIGKLFQKQTVTRERNEIIIALIPRVVPCSNACLPGHSEKLMQATTPLFRDKLRKNNRPGESKLPDAMYDPRKLKVRRIPELLFNLGDTYPHPPEFYFPAVSEYTDPIWGGSHKHQPTVLSIEGNPFSELQSNPEYYDAE